MAPISRLGRHELTLRFGDGLGATGPSLDPTGSELDLVRGESQRGPLEVPGRSCSTLERDVDAGDLVVAELQVAQSAACPSAKTPAFGFEYPKMNPQLLSARAWRSTRVRGVCVS